MTFLDGKGAGPERQLPLMPEFLPPFGEKVAFATSQWQFPDDTLAVLFRLHASGRAFECFISGSAIQSWARQMAYYGKMSETGLIIPEGGIVPDDFTF